MKKTLSNMGEHIINGIKYTIPLIVLYSVFSAIVGAGYITLPFVLSDYVFYLLLPVLTACIAHSIVPKISFVPGLLLGVVCAYYGLGYLGGIVTGLFVGYYMEFLVKNVKVNNEVISMIVGYLVIGLIGFIVSYFLVLYLVKPLVLTLLDYVYLFIDSISTTQTVIIVIVLALFTTLDLGGPFNKLAYGFIIQFYADGLFQIIGPVMISVMMPPFGVYIGLKLFRNRFNKEDHKSSKIALFGAVFGLTEGALQVGYRRPLTVLPILITGSIIGSVVATFLHIENTTLLVSIPGLFTVNHVIYYLLSVLVGVVVIQILFYLILPKYENKLA